MPEKSEDPERRVAGANVTKRFVRVGSQLIHYRMAGSGPAIVMLHDSPRSSRLHLETMRQLGSRFQVYAFDTPGYGNSTPLDKPDPTIADFAQVLGETLDTLGLAGAPLYAMHTSAKIALDHAANCPTPPGILILDGLSIPLGPPDEEFIRAYMSPFRLDDAGGYLAAEWTRLRDLLRWFPWFDARIETRAASASPTEDWMGVYALDMFSTGPHFSDAYGAAMRYDPLPALKKVASPTIVTARADDVLYHCLDRVPEDRSASVSCVRLPADRDHWLSWIEDTMAQAATVVPISANGDTGEGPIYADLPHGQMLVHRAGAGGKRPLLILEAPTTLHARAWQRALADERATLVPELSGYGESDPIEDGTVDDHADALAAMLRLFDSGPVDLLAIGFATPIAIALATRHPSLVAQVAIDGAAPSNPDSAALLADRLCPVFATDMSGAYLHRIWHLLRDSEAQWPWFDGSVAAQRRLQPMLAVGPLHQALLDVMKQPATYGDAALAALGVEPDAAALRQPVILFDLPGDPGYRGAVALAERIGHAHIVTRPAGLVEAAAVLLPLLEVDGASMARERRP